MESHNWFHFDRLHPCQQILDYSGSDKRGKHSSLLLYGNNYGRKKFNSTGPWRHCKEVELARRLKVKQKINKNIRPFVCPPVSGKFVGS